MQPMFPNSRKLLPPISPSSTNSHSSKVTEDNETENPNNTSNGVSCCAYNSLTLNPPFDSAMALTVLVLLTALFFMGFFSLYIRRFADESSVDAERRRSRSATAATTTSSYQPRLRGSAKGVDPTTIESLPVHVYGGAVVEQEISGTKLELECAICLSEFEEKDCVKEIPYCGHVFHVECIDTWLLSHVTCPLCRTAKLFPVEEKNDEGEGHVAWGEEGGSGVGEVHENDESGRNNEVRLAVEASDTWRDVEYAVEGLSATRTTECLVNGDRSSLHRSLSF